MSPSECTGDSCPLPKKSTSSDKKSAQGNASTSLNSIIIGTVLKALSVPCFLLLMRTVYNPFYSSPQCLLRLVNETAPDHYRQHIYFRDMTYDDSCAGQKIQDYVSSQYDTVAMMENKVLQVFLVLQGIIGFAALAYMLATKPFRHIVKNLVVPNVVIMQSMTAVLAFSHVEQDILYTLGNVMHHTDLSQFTGASNASMLATTPNGFTFSCIATMVWFFYFFYHMAPILRKAGYVSITGEDLVTLVSLWTTWAMYSIKFSHPLWHEDFSEDWKHARPFTHEYKGYKHLMVHHGNGDSFGSHPLVDPPLSFFTKGYNVLHNDILHLHQGSVECVVLGFVASVLGSLVVAAVSYCLLSWVGRATEYLWPEPKVTKTKEI